MRRRLAEAGVPQPEFAAVRTIHEGKDALDTVGLPAVLKPADCAGQRGLFLLRSVDDLEARLHAALSESSNEEAIVESFHDGLEVNGLVVVRGGDPQIVTLSDRLRPAGGRLRRGRRPRLPLDACSATGWRRSSGSRATSSGRSGSRTRSSIRRCS